MRREGSNLYERVLTGIMTTMIATLSTVTNGGDDKDDGDDGGDDSGASADDGDAGVDYGNHSPKSFFFPEKSKSITASLPISGIIARHGFLPKPAWSNAKKYLPNWYWIPVCRFKPVWSKQCCFSNVARAPSSRCSVVCWLLFLATSWTKCSAT